MENKMPMAGKVVVAIIAMLITIIYVKIFG